MLKFPKHVSMTLSHNDCHTCYRTVAEEDALSDGSGMCEMDWISDEQRAKAIANNNVWELHWYPDTPVGFRRASACDLEALMEFVNANFKQ